MSSENKKPLIFVQPLSQTLQKLKEVLDENADSEGIEIFDVESLDEAGQLIPTIGQAVILIASPKNCALMLQGNRKYIKKLQTKTLLLTPKAIPRKTLDKFSKVGLTECIVEPVNPKTLLYKVRLQLRSITVEAEEDEQDMQKKFGDGNKNDSIKTNEKMRAEKGVILDDEEDDGGKKKKDSKEDVLEDYTKPKKKSSYKEEAISGFYKNKKKAEDISEEEEEEEVSKKKGYQEEAIEGHLKGKVAKEDHPEEEEAPKKEKIDFPDMEEDLEAIKHQINLEVENDMNRERRKEVDEVEEDGSRKKNTNLSVNIEEEERERDQQPDTEDLGGHYKGKVAKKLDIEDDEESITQEADEYDEEEREKKKKLQLAIDDEAEDFVDEKELPEEIEKKKKAKLDIDIEEDSKDYVEKPQLKVVDDEDDKDLAIEEYEGEELEQKKKAELNIIDSEEDEEEDPNKVDEIDGYLRGGAAKKPIIIDDEKDFKEKAEKQEEDDSRDYRESVKLDITDDEDREEEDDDIYERNKKDPLKNAVGLDIDDDSDYNKKKAEREEEDERDPRKRSSYQEDDLGGYGKKHSAHTESKKDRHNKANARADHIKTHYSSKESIKHGEDNWDSQWDKKGKQEQDFAAKKKESEISYAKDDLGEQTIDYGQLKKEFEGVAFDSDAIKKKEYGNFDQVAEVKTYQKTVLNPEGTLEIMEFEEINNAPDEEDESHQVFLPDSRGIENVIEVLNFYLKETNKDQEDAVYNFLSEKIHQKFNGDLSLYFAEPGGQSELYHCGAVLRECGQAPNKPREEDYPTKREFKDRLKDYEEEKKLFESKQNEVLSQWKARWESRIETWLTYKTPSWRDHTFQETENEFVFPFFEGVSFLGMAVFTPLEPFKELNAGALEVSMESIRSPMLTQFHTTQGEGKVRENPLKKKENKGKKKGFFKGLFGKLAG